MKIKKLRELRREDYALIATILLAIFVVVRVFMIHYVPIKEAYYDEEAKELVISPGWFYTLEGYRIDHSRTYSEEILLPVHGDTETELRFRPVPGNYAAHEEIWIDYRDSLTGKSGHSTLSIDRINDWNSFDGGIDNIYFGFYAYPEE